MSNTIKSNIKKGYKVNVYIPSNDSDELNPSFLFNTTSTELLCAMVNGQIDPMDFIKNELSNRGVDNNGQ